MNSNDPDNVVSVHDVKPKRNFWKEFNNWDASFEFIFVMGGISILNFAGVIWCAYHHNAHGIAMMLMMSLATVWVTSANEDPYS